MDGTGMRPGEALEALAAEGLGAEGLAAEGLAATGLAAEGLAAEGPAATGLEQLSGVQGLPVPGTCWGAKVQTAELGAIGWVLLVLLVTRLLHWSVALTATVVDVRRRKAERLAGPPRLPEGLSLSVLVPAYNEAAVIAACLAGIDRALCAVPTLRAEVLVIDDGSNDGTAAVAEAARADWRSAAALRIHSIANRGKAGALNAGLALGQLAAERVDGAPASEVVLLVVDADSRIAADGLTPLLAPFADAQVLAVAGNVRVGNLRTGRRAGGGGWVPGLLTRLQHVEYVMGLDFLRRAQAVLQCVLTVPGAAGAFRRSAVVAVGGFPTETLAEDTDLTLRLHWAGRGVTAGPEGFLKDESAWRPERVSGLERLLGADTGPAHPVEPARRVEPPRKVGAVEGAEDAGAAWAGGRIVVAPEAVCDTEVPETWKHLFWQRRRWMLGNLQCAWRHRAAMRPLRFGFLGGWALPGFVVGHLGLGFSPLLLLLAGAQVAQGRVAECLLWTAAALSLDLATAALAFVRAGVSLRWLAWVPVQRLVFLGFGAVVFWGMAAKVLSGHRVRWRKLPRVGLGAPRSEP